MRLHCLDLAAVGPFAGEQHVDFDSLSGAGLFLLDGPTGAGKSTVLDAITFALYGAGRGNGDGRLHSDFAERDARPFVRLEFSVGGARYRITRTPEFERPKKRGDGMTVEHATAHLERSEGGTWVSRSSNKAEIAEILDDVIGLNREQFNQVVLLPQGEFASFLRAGDDERRDVLSRLFGTQLYQRVTDELDARRQVAARQLDAATARLRGCVAAAAEAAGLDGAARDALCDLAGGERTARLDDLRAVLDRAAADGTAQAEAAERAVQAARAQSDRAELAADRLRRYAQLQTQAAQHADDQERVVRERDEAGAAQRAEPVRALLDAVASAERGVARASAAAARMGALEPASSSAAAQAADDLRARAAALDHVVELEDQLDTVLDRVAAAQLAVDTAALAEEAYAADLAVLPDRLAAAEAAERARGARAEVTRRRAAAADSARLEPAVAAARDTARRAADDHQRCVDEYQELVAARLAGMAAELAGQLRDGEPCAVCGAPDHPAPASAAGPVPTAEQVTWAERLRAAAEAARRAAEAELADLDRELASAVATAGGAALAELDEQLAELTAVVVAAPDVAAAELRAEATKLGERHAAAVAALATARAEYDTTTQERDRVQAALAAAAEGAVSVRARRDELRAEATRLAALAEALRAVEDAVRARDDAHARAEAEALAAGFATLTDGAAAVRTPAQREQLAARVEEWERADVAIGAALDAAEFDEVRTLSAAELPDAVAAAERAVRDATRTVEQAQQAAADATEHAVRAAHAARRFAQRAAELDEAVAAHDQLAAQVAPVIHLARLARGMAGQRRVALTTFVLRHWFGQVVAAANVRLRAISSGRYELIRVDEGESRTERAGLTLTVLDAHTGESRSPRSLSGGETFYTSLALALGLADVVRAEAGGVDLDTLFVDEGFGSLDPETLNQVMDVIDDLRDGGRVVGVVSHVAELKERIPERLEVRRLPDGSSALRVVA